jgi:hypothetical protein
MKIGEIIKIGSRIIAGAGTTCISGKAEPIRNRVIHLP